MGYRRYLSQSVCQFVHVILFFKTYIKQLLDDEHEGRWNFAWKLYVPQKNEDNLQNREDVKN